MTKLMIIIGSNRPGRAGLPVGLWTESVAAAHGGFSEIDLVDLAELNLPFMDEPNHPRLAQYTHQHTRDWSARVAAADAFVFVMPEYNYGYSAVLKNAIDFLHNEWLYKPVAFVSYGGPAAGTRAVQLIKPVVTTLKMTPLMEAVAIASVAQFINDEGDFVANEFMTASTKVMFDELLRVAPALQPLRPVPTS